MSGAAIAVLLNVQNGLSTLQANVGVASGSTNDPFSVTAVLRGVETSAPALTVRLLGPETTGMVRITSFGIAQLTSASRTLLSFTCVVSDTMFNVIEPEAGAVADTETSGVVNVATAGSPTLPGMNGPGWPYLSWLGTGNDAASGVVVGASAQFAGLVDGGWFRFAAPSDL